MKIKGIILTAAICAGSVVGISYGVSRVMSSNVKPVEVVEVDSVNTAGYNSRSTLTSHSVDWMMIISLSRCMFPRATA